MGVDITALDGLAAQLRTAQAQVLRAVQPVVSKGALNIKNEWRANATVSAGRHGRLYPSSIGYDLNPGPDYVEAVIGPDKGARQGALGNLIEFGSVNNPPHNDGGRALESEDPRFVDALSAAAEAAVLA